MQKLLSLVKRVTHICVQGGKRFVAFFIALAVLLSPLQLPFSEMVNEERTDTKNVSPKEYYDTYSNAGTQGSIVTYTKGSDIPVIAFAPDNTNTEIMHVEQNQPVLEKEAVPTLNTDFPEITQQKTKQFATHANRIAAQQIAKGSSASELVSVSLDAQANIVATKDEHGATTEAEYDMAGRPIKIVNPDGTASYYGYDIDGNLTGISQSKPMAVANMGIVKTLAYTFLEPLFAFADANEETSLEYDGENLTTVSSNVQTSSFSYDEEGLLTRELRADGSAVEYAYDELGNVVETTEIPSDGKNDGVFSLRSLFSWSFADIFTSHYTETAQYNDDNRLSQFSIYKDIPTPNDSVAPPISPESIFVPTMSSSTESVQSVVMPSELSTSTEAVSIPLEPAPLIPNTNEITPVSTSSIIESIVPNIVSWLTNTTASLTYMLREALSFSYAEEAESSTSTILVSDAVVNTTSTNSSTSSETIGPLLDLAFSYDTQGNIASVRTSHGLQTTFTYNQTTNALSTKSVSTPDGTLLARHYETDSTARVVRTDNETYAYTDTNSLERAGETEYVYDERGNRTSAKTPNSITTYTYDGNRLNHVTYPDGRTITYTYNERGAVVESSDSQKGDIVYTYNVSGAIETITTASEKIAYTYNALGQRVSRTSSLSGTITYNYTGSNLKKVTNEMGTVLREYFYTPSGELIAVMMHDTFYYVVTDRSHSVIALIDAVTGSMKTQTYDAWGMIRESTITRDLDIGYIGTFSESHLNVSILGPRVYDPTLGRFLSKDPLPGAIIDALSQNEYIYAKNDPVNQYDPSGHESILADKSDSPKRALVETEASIDALQTELHGAENRVASLTQELKISPEDTIRASQLDEATFAVTSLTASLDILLSIKADQTQEIADNELSAEIARKEALAPVTTTTTQTIQTTQSLSDSILVSPSTTTPVEQASTSNTESSATTTEEVIIISPETTSTSSQSLPTDTPAPILEQNITTPALPPNITVSFIDSISLAFTTFLDDHTLTAEAKSKKSKKKASTKAKNKQIKKAKEVARLKAKVHSLQTKLVGLAQVRVTELTNARTSSSLATSVKNLTTTTKNKETRVSTAPNKPSLHIVPTGSTSAGITHPQSIPTQSYSQRIQNILTLQTAHIVLGSCGLFAEIIFVIQAICDTTDGILYAVTGDYMGAGLSLGSVLPIGGIALGVTKQIRLVLTPLRTAPNIPEFLKIAEALKVEQASTETAKVLAGSADAGREVFEAQTKGWAKKDIPNDKGILIEAISPDGTYSMNYRTLASSPAREPFKKINATIDVQEFTVYSNEYREKIGKVIEIKFAE